MEDDEGEGWTWVGFGWVDGWFLDGWFGVIRGDTGWWTDALSDTTDESAMTNARSWPINAIHSSPGSTFLRFSDSPALGFPGSPILGSPVLRPVSQLIMWPKCLLGFTRQGSPVSSRPPDPASQQQPLDIWAFGLDNLSWKPKQKVWSSFLFYRHI